MMESDFFQFFRVRLDQYEFQKLVDYVESLGQEHYENGYAEGYLDAKNESHSDGFLRSYRSC